MPAAVACPKCNKKYRLPDHMLGKPVKCPGCGSTFKTPGRQQTPARPSAVAAGQKPVPDQQAAARTRQQLAGLKQLGIDGPLQREPDVFSGPGPVRGPDPLANHRVEDPGFGEAVPQDDHQETVESEQDPVAQMFQNPALATETKKKNRATGRKRSELPLTSQPWLMLTIVFVPLFAVLAGLSLAEVMAAETTALLAVIALGLYGLACLAINVWGLMLVYRTTPSVLQVVLCVLVPFYIIYYIIVHWKDMKSYGYALIAQAIVGALGAGVMTLVGGASATAG